MKKTEEKGITLVALIITVIVMFFLLAVVVETVTDDDVIGEANQLVNRVEEHKETLNDIRSEVRNMIR